MRSRRHAGSSAACRIRLSRALTRDIALRVEHDRRSPRLEQPDIVRSQMNVAASCRQHPDRRVEPVLITRENLRSALLPPGCTQVRRSTAQRSQTTRQARLPRSVRANSVTHNVQFSGGALTCHARRERIMATPRSRRARDAVSPSAATAGWTSPAIPLLTLHPQHALPRKLTIELRIR